jgi:hypothetical protein
MSLSFEGSAQNLGNSKSDSTDGGLTTTHLCWRMSIFLSADDTKTKDDIYDPRYTKV